MSQIRNRLLEIHQELDRAPIFTVAHSKGGAGKTTIATNLAGRLAEKGVDVLLADLDKQRSATTWSGIRRGTDLPPVNTTMLEGRGVAHELLDKANRYEAVVVDVGGKDSAELRGGVAVADLVIVPTQVSAFAMWAAEDIAEVLDTASAYRTFPVTALAVLNEVSTHPQQSHTSTGFAYIEGARDRGIRGMDLLREAKSFLRGREAFRRAAESGRTIFEFRPRDASAIGEMGRVIDEAVETLRSVVLEDDKGED